jgi:hypothetical protein
MIAQLSVLVTAGNSSSSSYASHHLNNTSGGRMNKGEVLEATVKRMLTLNHTISELFQAIASLDANHEVLARYSHLIPTLITQLPQSLYDENAPIVGSLDINEIQE